MEIRFKLQQGVEEEFPDQKANSDKNSIGPLEASLNTTVRMASEVQKKIDDLQKSGTDQEMLNDSISTTVILLGILSLGIVIVSALLQVSYLKKFFRQKKLL